MHMNKPMITLVAALGLGLGGCATTTYNGMIYQDGSYYAPPADGNGDYYVAPEPQPYYYGDPYFYGPYGDPFWWPPFGAGWGGHPCSAMYRFCPLWESRWYDPWYDPWYTSGSGFGISLTFGDAGWYGGGIGWYGGSYGGGWRGGGHHGRGGHDGHDGRGDHDGNGGHGRPPHRGPERPSTPPAADGVAWTDPRVDAGDLGAAAGEALDADPGTERRFLRRSRWYQVAPGAPVPQSGMPAARAGRSAPADGQWFGGGTHRAGGSDAGSPRSEASRGSGRSDEGGGSRSERRSEARSSDDDGGSHGGHGGRRVRGGSDDD
jgi:hypothetical protein